MGFDARMRGGGTLASRLLSARPLFGVDFALIGETLLSLWLVVGYGLARNYEVAAPAKGLFLSIFQMNVLSLFDGMSCGQIALNRAGVPYENYFASEIDKWAIKVASVNFPDTIHLGDVRNVQGSNLPKIDLLIGGSPCQGFSLAGKKLNFEDERSSLFFEFIRILNETKPTFFLLENVFMKQDWQDVITDYLGVPPILINSSLVSAQKRRRLYWTNIPNVTIPEERGVLFQDVLERDSALIEKAFAITATYYKKGSEETRKRQFKRCQRPIAWIDEETTRWLTPLECERLQTVPDNYTNVVSNTQRYKMIGNGWTVDVIAHIFEGLKQV